MTGPRACRSAPSSHWTPVRPATAAESNSARPWKRDTLRPGRDDPFSARMNAVPKLVVSRTLADTSAWANSRITDGDLAGAVKRERRDVVVAGSRSVVHALMAEDLIDEYRLLVFPALLRTGERLFPADGPPAYLECLSAERAGTAVLTRYVRAPAI
ncbi:hypothetical protein FAF44_44020 [Nonomuraea sp. MG754425]|nr:dihydrofolate reductase family protein [Nonomuraea sp. MG754425]MCF6475287.1 hypothetical protein [Nonomuraea sp. MG754425]